MRVVILAGGLGTRLREETSSRPKPMVAIGGEPILWHIMKHYAHHGCEEFLIALGYLGDVVKKYFLDAYQLNANLTIDFARRRILREELPAERWRVRLVDTGPETATGGRLKRLQPWLADETFMVTYGDGVGNVDLHALLAFHRAQGRLATVTAVRPPARFGSLVLEGDNVSHFTEKPEMGEGWINGGFLVLEPGVFEYLRDDRVSLEAEALQQLARDGQLAAFRHHGFWQCMDTLRDKSYLERLWEAGRAPWRTWGDDPPPRHAAPAAMAGAPSAECPSPAAENPAGAEAGELPGEETPGVNAANQGHAA